MERIILHCDLNNFYASVECVLNPELKDAPLAVSGNPEKRHGVILAKNEAAKKFGIKTGDVIWEAKQKCPDIKLVPPHFSLYSEYSKKVFDIYSEFTCYVEPFGPDECWLDCTGSVKLFGSGKEIADKIRQTVKERTQLTLSAGVSFNKVFAKMGSDLKKPDATTVITKADFKKILWPLPASEMLMVGKKTAEALKKLNIRTVGELAAADESVLKNRFGINGLKLKSYALGEDSEPVREYVTERVPKSFGHGMTATRDITNYSDATALIFYLSELVAVRMRKNGFKGYGVHLDLRSFELKSISRSQTLSSPLATAKDIADEAVKLLKSVWKENPPLRTVTVSVFDISPDCEGVQMGFLDSEKLRREKLERTIDKIRAKYGSNTILRANIIGRDFIYDKTDAEDFLPFKR